MIIVLLSLLAASPSFAQGILPGEPDPNLSPRQDAVEADKTLVDDRKPCAKGTKKFQKMKCGLAGKEQPECENFSPVFECLKKPRALKCKKPETLVPVYRCE